jgi:hypothetical protein
MITLKTIKRPAICTSCRQTYPKGSDMLYIEAHNSNHRNVFICNDCCGTVGFLLRELKINMIRQTKKEYNGDN